MATVVSNTWRLARQNSATRSSTGSNTGGEGTNSCDEGRTGDLDRPRLGEHTRRHASAIARGISPGNLSSACFATARGISTGHCCCRDSMSDCGRLCISTSLSLSRVSGTDPEVARRLWNRSLPAPRISGNGLEGSHFGKKGNGLCFGTLASSAWAGGETKSTQGADTKSELEAEACKLPSPDELAI